MQVDPANALETAYLGRRLADYALKQGSDPDQARRARGEADFLTSRAPKLAPNNDEVKKAARRRSEIAGTKDELTPNPNREIITPSVLWTGRLDRSRISVWCDGRAVSGVVTADLVLANTRDLKRIVLTVLFGI